MADDTLDGPASVAERRRLASRQSRHGFGLSPARFILALGFWLGLACMGAGAQTPSFDLGICETEETGTEEIDCESTAGTTAAFTPDPARQPHNPVSRQRLLAFWRAGCHRCEEARDFLDAVEAQDPRLEVEWIEVRENPEGRARFRETMQALDLPVQGVPVFVLGNRSVVGFRRGVTEETLLRLLASAPVSQASEQAEIGAVDLPLFGRLDWQTIPLPAFTILIGLTDGLNPCAFWVLMVMLGVLMHAGSRGRMALFGATFVVMSGVVYFAFMTAWAGLFSALGGARWLTVALGVVLVLMGLVNLKELVWFKRGVSLMIPERVKPGLFRRMRHVASSASVGAAFIGISVLAFVVNLVELGCTIGLPAVYTRILTIRQLSWTARHSYLALYNLAYMVPLSLVVLACVVTLRRVTLSERGAKVLKAVSGALLLAFGLLFLFSPRALG